MAPHRVSRLFAVGVAGLVAVVVVGADPTLSKADHQAVLSGTVAAAEAPAAAEAGAGVDAEPTLTKAHSEAVLSGTVAAAGAPTLPSPAPGGSAVVGIAPSSAYGYYVLRADGEVDAEHARERGSPPQRLTTGVTATGIAPDRFTGGYWVVRSNGVIRAVDAPWRGQPQIPRDGWGQYPAAVAIAPAASGDGYYVLRANGTVQAFHAPFYGDQLLPYGATAPVVATSIALDRSTGGYYVLTSVGNVYNFHAPWYGSPWGDGQGRPGGDPYTAIATTRSGYDIVDANGSVTSFHTASFGSVSGILPDGATASALATDVRTAGYWVAADIVDLGGYLNPLRRVTSLVPQEIDQGVDYCGSGPVYAIGNGVVENTENSGWPSGTFISYRLSSGPAAGLFVYVAENVTPSVYVSEDVGPNTVLGTVHDALTCMETGWADSSDPYGLAAGYFEYNGKNSTAYGINFSDLLAALGARPGLVQPYGPPGPLPAGWPTW